MRQEVEIPVKIRDEFLTLESTASNIWDFVAVFNELPSMLECGGYEYHKVSYRFNDKEHTIFYRVQP